MSNCYVCIVSVICKSVQKIVCKTLIIHAGELDMMDHPDYSSVYSLTSYLSWEIKVN